MVQATSERVSPILSPFTRCNWSVVIINLIPLSWNETAATALHPNSPAKFHVLCDYCEVSLCVEIELRGGEEEILMTERPDSCVVTSEREKEDGDPRLAGK